MKLSIIVSHVLLIPEFANLRLELLGGGGEFYLLLKMLYQGFERVFREELSHIKTVIIQHRIYFFKNTLEHLIFNKYKSENFKRANPIPSLYPPFLYVIQDEILRTYGLCRVESTENCNLHVFARYNNSNLGYTFRCFQINYQAYQI